MKRRTKSLQERFDSKWIPEPNTGCWLWTSCILTNGYGQIHLHENGKNYKLPAHHASWMLHVGKVPKNLWVLHKCDTPICVNPAHLFLGTPKDNSQDRQVKGRSNTPRGSRHGHVKITEEIVRAIRADNRRPQSVIAAEYGISQSHFSGIKTGRFWRHI